MISPNLQTLFHGISFIFRQLPATERWLHALVMLWVVWQLVTSLGMHIHGNTTAAQYSIIGWLHIYGGMGLFLPAVTFFAIVLYRRRVNDLFPWLKGNLGQITADLKMLKSLKLPKANAGGLAATVEGLGLLALLLALCTGLLWFIVSTISSASAPLLLEIHKTSVGAIELYFYGHGAFALLHFIVWWRG